jgi:hypothetical protein
MNACGAAHAALRILPAENCGVAVRMQRVIAVLAAVASKRVRI